MIVSDQLQARVALPPGDISPETKWIRGWERPRAGMYASEVGKDRCVLNQTPVSKPVTTRWTSTHDIIW
jgi:hypothetical protein